MQTRFLEAGHPPYWGRFMLGRYTSAQLAEPARLPGCEDYELVSTTGPGIDQLWMHDLVTGEAARFTIATARPWDALEQLQHHRPWVCPLYAPTVYWVFNHINTHPHRETWWDDLPRTVDLTLDDMDILSQLPPSWRVHGPTALQFVDAIGLVNRSAENRAAER